MDPRRDLPADVITFLLTDVVGSTRLWDVAPGPMSSSIQRHEELIEAAVNGNGGRLLKSRGEGDSTFSVFSRASDATLAAAEAQANLELEPWPAEATIRVRMALHVGEATERDDDYFGPTVNRAARLRALAGPGQVLLSRSVAELVLDHLPAHLHLVEVGPRKLRDLARPEQVYALAGPALSTAVGDHSIAGDATPLPHRLARPEPNAFFGRTEERAVLDWALFHVETERWRRLVLVSGEPGVGKTRLVAEAARAYHAGGATIVLGRCVEGMGAPFCPFLEALGHLARHAPQQVVRAHVRRHGGRLARLVPDLAERSPQTLDEPVADADAERYLVFAAASDLIAEASLSHPIVLIVDDLQWIDEMSLQFLRYLIQVGDPGALLVLVTCRDTEGVSGAVAELLSQLWREDGTERITLEGFDASGIRELVQASAGEPLGEPGETLVKALAAETGGNPFIVRQVLLHMWDIGAISRNGENWTLRSDLSELTLPPSVQELVVHRVERAGEVAQRSLSAAAVVGHDFEMGLVASLVDIDEDQVLEALEAARAVGLIRRGVRPGSFSFSHGIVSHALGDRLGPARRQRLHARIATDLATSPQPDANIVAHHCVEAGEAGDPDQAAFWCASAGRAAMAALAPADAVKWFQEALAAVQRAGTSDPDAKTELLIELGSAQRLAGDRLHRRTLLEAAALAEDTHRHDLLIRAALADHRGYESLTGVVDRPRVRVLEAALAVAPPMSGDRARLLANLASQLTFDPDRGRTLALADEAWMIAREIGDPRVLQHVLLARFPTVLSPDNASQCLAETAELVTLAQQLDDPSALVLACSYRFTACLVSADLEGIDNALGLARHSVDRLALPFLQHLVFVKENMRALLSGDLEASERFADLALESGLAGAVIEASTHHNSQLARIRQAQNRLDELLPVSDQPGLTFVAHPAVRATLCLYYCRLGRIDDARSLFSTDALDGFSALAWDRLYLITAAAYADVCAYLELPEPAALLYERLLPFSNLVPASDATFLAPVAYYCARLAVVIGNVECALEHFAEADRINAALESPIWSAICRAEWAAALLNRGNPGDVSQARALVDAVTHEGQRLGYWPAVTRCAELREQYFSQSPNTANVSRGIIS
jgi:class 3 adenylate cyclase/tetratricopeptide (TPR) repeat protein